MRLIMEYFEPVIYIVIESSVRVGAERMELVKSHLYELFHYLEAAQSEMHLKIRIALLEYSLEAKWLTPNGPEYIEDLVMDDLRIGGSDFANFGNALEQLTASLSDYCGHRRQRYTPAFIFISFSDATDDITEPLKKLKLCRPFQRGIKIAFAFGSNAVKNIMTTVVGNDDAVLDEKHLEICKRIFDGFLTEWDIESDHPFDIDDYTADNTEKNVMSDVAIKPNGSDKMMTDAPVLKNMIAYSEIWAILNLMEDCYSSRVPQQVKAFFEEERLKDYVPQIDVEKPLTEQNLQRETIVLLAILNVNYWCDSEEERQAYLMEMAKNDNKDYDLDGKSWDWSNLFDFNQEGNNNMKTDKELKVKIATGEISVTEKPLTVLRCQLAPCSPDQALDKCLTIKKIKETSTVEVVNVGQDTVSVVYDLRCGSYTFELPNDTTIIVNGKMDIAYSDGKVNIDIEPNYSPGTVTLNYSNGEAFTLHMGDKVFSYVKDYYGSTLLLEYKTEVQGDDWDNEDW